MDSTENCVCWHRNRNLLISTLIVLLVSSMTIVRFKAEGRSIPKLVDQAAQEGRAEKKWVRILMVRGQIGSRPPNCEKRCSTCTGHCEAIQVPIVPRVQRQRRSPVISDHASRATHSTTIAYSRDGVSNYKPMCWKCKCGDFIFNP